MDGLLFEIPKDKQSDGKTCLTCVHRERWQCGGSVIQYCGARKSNRTNNGRLNIKCKDSACYQYKELKEEQK